MPRNGIDDALIGAFANEQPLRLSGELRRRNRKDQPDKDRGHAVKNW
jgi:hypothetical protein